MERCVQLQQHHPLCAFETSVTGRKILAASWIARKVACVQWMQCNGNVIEIFATTALLSLHVGVDTNGATRAGLIAADTSFDLAIQIKTGPARWFVVAQAESITRTTRQ